MQRTIEYSLTSLWLLCLLLTAMECFTPLEIVSHSLRVGAHCGLVLLFVYPVSRFIGGFWLTKKLALWLAGLLAGAYALEYLSIIIWPLGALLWPASIATYQFFLGRNPWQTEYVHFRRGPEVMVSQVRYVTSSPSGSRTVQLTPITSLLQLVRPVPPIPIGGSQRFSYDLLSQAGDHTPGYVGWTRVGAAHQTGIHAQDSVASQQLAAGRAAYQLAEEREHAALASCNRTRQAEDSLALLGRRPTLQLPAITRHGANTFGCWLGDQLWCDHFLSYSKETGCITKSTSGFLNHHTLHVSARMHLGAVDRVFDLVIPHVTRPGTYQLAHYDQLQPNDSWAFKNTGSATWLLSAGVQVRISRFDTVARVAAGTFQGNLYQSDTPQKLIPLRQGRFDVKL